MANRVCPNCGHIENEYTYFCTECGSKTVEQKEGNSPVTMKPVITGNQVASEKENVLDTPSLKEVKAPDKSVTEATEDAEAFVGSDETESISYQANEYKEQHNTSTTTENRKKINPTIIAMASVIAVLILVIIAMLAGKKDGKENQVVRNDINETENNSETNNQPYKEAEPTNVEETESTDKEVADMAEENVEESYNDTDEFEEPTMEDVDSDNNQFGINSSVIEDYSNNLEPRYYEYYDGGVSDFSFYYPLNLYNSVDVNEEDFETAYGRNIKTITFTGTGGSELIYAISQRADGFTIPDMTEYVHGNESYNLYDAADIINSAKGDHGKVIVTGWDSSNQNYAIYDMLRIEDSYVLQMKVIFPNYTSEEDRLQKAYVTECFYRLCGFSDSTTSVRSYEEFLESNQ